jgi:hypothetical protein
VLDPRDCKDRPLLVVALDGVRFFKPPQEELFFQKHQDDRSGKANRRLLHRLWHVPELIGSSAQLIECRVPLKKLAQRGMSTLFIKSSRSRVRRSNQASGILVARGGLLCRDPVQWYFHGIPNQTVCLVKFTFSRWHPSFL